MGEERTKRVITKVTLKILCVRLSQTWACQEGNIILSQLIISEENIKAWLPVLQGTPFNLSCLNDFPPYQHVIQTILDISGLPPTADQGISIISVLQTIHLVFVGAINITVGPPCRLVYNVGKN